MVFQEEDGALIARALENEIKKGINDFGVPFLNGA
jgi:hypothetical protein